MALIGQLFYPQFDRKGVENQAEPKKNNRALARPFGTKKQKKNRRKKQKKILGIPTCF